jgi:parvulin-like peptidyl-prolyl isomerase
MSEKTWERNTSGMVAHAHRRKEEKRLRVDEVITRLVRERQTINFNAVAIAAGVSKAYLYSQPDLRQRIEALRQQEMEQAIRGRVDRLAPGKTDGSRDLVILAKDRRIKELEAENRKLQQQLKIALGKAYDRL